MTELRMTVGNIYSGGQEPVLVYYGTEFVTIDFTDDQSAYVMTVPQAEILVKALAEFIKKARK